MEDLVPIVVEVTGKISAGGEEQTAISGGAMHVKGRVTEFWTVADSYPSRTDRTSRSRRW